MELRPYQREAVDAVWQHLRMREDNPCVVLPTAAGKSLVLSEICREAHASWGGRVLVLTHVKELVEQNAAKMMQLLGPGMVGIYSAGLKSRDTEHPVIAAGIQSVYRRACELGPIDLCVVDEAHLLPPEGEGMYQSFLKDARIVSPHLRVIGLTATPYRMSSGEICGPDNILNDVCYEVGVRDLIMQGYLCPLVSKAGRCKADTSGLHIRGGEFVADEAEALMDSEALVSSAVREIVELTAERNACLIFAAGVKHGEHIVRILRAEHGIECGFVTGNTPTSMRDRIITRFKGERTDGLFSDPPLKYLCNVNVLTTGFDAPHIDCVAMLRPTMSPGLMYQAFGRGFRLHPSKKDCLVLDFADNLLRHGPVDCITVGHRPKPGEGDAPAKQCPQCNSVIHAGYAICPDCGFAFPKPEVKHGARANNAAVLSGEVTTEEHEVKEVAYSVHQKRGASEDHPRSMRVEYRIGFQHWVSEWVCPEHSGFARGKFEAWWRKHTDMPLPSKAADAVMIARAGGLAETKSITVRSVSGDEFDRIIAYDLGEKPAPVEFDSEAESQARMRREDGWDDFDDSDTVFAARDAEGAHELVGAYAFTDDEIPF